MLLCYVGGTLSTSDGGTRKSSIPVTPTFLKNRPVSVIQDNNLPEKNNGISKPGRLYLEAGNIYNVERNKSNSKSKEVKYTSRKENINLNLVRNKSPTQCKGVILEDLEVQ